MAEGQDKSIDPRALPGAQTPEAGIQFNCTVNWPLVKEDNSIKGGHGFLEPINVPPSLSECYLTVIFH